MIHIKKRESELKKIGFGSAENYVLNIANNFNEVYQENAPNRFLLVKRDNRNGVMPVGLELSFDGKNYYTVVSAIPMRNKNFLKKIKEELPIYSGHLQDSASVSNNGTVSDYNNSEVGVAESKVTTVKSDNSSVNNNLSQKQNTVNDKQTPNANMKEYKNTQVKAQISFTAKGEKLLPQTAKLRGKEIAVISKAVKNASDNENLMGLTLPIGSYKLTVDDWEKAGKSYANQNYGWHKLIQSKFIEAKFYDIIKYGTLSLIRQMAD